MPPAMNTVAIEKRAVGRVRNVQTRTIRFLCGVGLAVLLNGLPFHEFVCPEQRLGAMPSIGPGRSHFTITGALRITNDSRQDYRGNANNRAC